MCREKCQILANRNGSVQFIDQWADRTLTLGRYVAEAQQFVPRTEAPVRDIRLGNGWRVVASAFFDRLSGGADTIFAVTSNEEHAYHALTQIWFLPQRGDLKQVLGLSGTYANFVRAVPGRVAGVTIARQTYDGQDAKTKGIKLDVQRTEPRPLGSVNSL